LGAVIFPANAPGIREDDLSRVKQWWIKHRARSGERSAVDRSHNSELKL